MLFASEEIFKNAEYLYSTTDKRGNPEVSGWDYFYVPVKLGDDTAGVRIAVRNMIQPNEAQIYNWGIKKEDAPLGGGGPLPFGSASTGASSDASSNEMSSGPVAGTQGANIDSNAIAPSETNIRSTAGNSQENSSGRGERGGVRDQQPHGNRAGWCGYRVRGRQYLSVERGKKDHAGDKRGSAVRKPKRPDDPPGER